MRTWLFLLSFFLPIFAGRADDFPNDVPPTFKFHETYKDVVVGDPDFPGEYLTAPRLTLSFSGDASILGLDLTQLDFLSTFSLDLGAVDLEYSLGEDDDFDPEDPNPQISRAATFEVDAYDMNGDPEPGLLKVSWIDGKKVKFSFAHEANIVTDGPKFITDDYIGVDEPDIDRDDLDLSLSFGPYSYDLRTVYMLGSATLKTDERVPDDLSDISIDGAIDGIVPSVAFTAPSGLTINADQTTVDGKFNFTGTASDTRVVARNGTNLTLPGKVTLVELRVSDTLTGGTFVPATLDNLGNWTVPNTPIFVGKNYVTLRVYDSEGNLKTLDTRTITYTLRATMTITASATGYTPADATAHLAAGTASGSFLGGTKKITMIVGDTPPKSISSGEFAGTPLTMVAKPGVGSVFNGWVGVTDATGPNPQIVINEVTETLRFPATPRLTLTANFVPNPFTPAIVGTYLGFVSGADPAGRGAFKLTLGKTGAFSGSFKVGALVVPISGKILGSGFWKGKVVRAGKTYDITLNLDFGINGDHQITGTLTGNGLNSTVVADLNRWKNKTNEATAYVGYYNVLLPPDGANTDPNFPVGTGFGRVNISKVGVVKFVGKLGDGSAASSSTVLVKRASGTVDFPLFVALDKKLGAVSGIVTFADTATSDLAGSLDWQEPATTGNEPQAFKGRIALHGSFYQAPPKSPLPDSRVILNGSAGLGQLTMQAPAFTKPTNVQSVPLGPFAPFNVTLDPVTNAIAPLAGPAVGMTNLKLSFNRTTGLLTGSYRDEFLKKTVKFFGAASQKAGLAGGVFLRGNRAGTLELKP